MPANRLSKTDLRRGIRYLTLDGTASQILVTLTGGAFLVGFALELGASNFMIGLIAAISPLAQVVQIPAIYLVEKIRNRRLITMVHVAAGRSFYLLIGLIPFLFSGHFSRTILIICLAMASVFAAVATCSWNSWMRDLIPVQIMGRVFSRRLAIASATGIGVSLLAGFFLDHVSSYGGNWNVYGYSLLFFAGFLAGEIGVAFIGRIPSRPMQSMQTGFFSLLLSPFRNPNFRNLIRFSFTWSFTLNLAAPFFTVYLLKRLGYPMSFVVFMMIISQLMNLLFIRIWGRYTDRFSNKSVLNLCVSLYVLCLLAWTFTTIPEPHAFTLHMVVVLHVFMGIAISGITLAQGNIGLKLAPHGQATAYLASNNFINSLAAGTAPMLGGLFADYFEKTELVWTIHWNSPGGEWMMQTLSLQQWDFFFFIAFLTGFIALHRLALVKEMGEVSEKVVMKEFFTEVMVRMRNLSTLSGMTQLFHIPFSLLVAKRRKVRQKRSPD